MAIKKKPSNPLNTQATSIIQQQISPYQQMLKEQAAQREADLAANTAGNTELQRELARLQQQQEGSYARLLNNTAGLQGRDPAARDFIRQTLGGYLNPENAALANVNTIGANAENRLADTTLGGQMLLNSQTGAQSNQRLASAQNMRGLEYGQDIRNRSGAAAKSVAAQIAAIRAGRPEIISKLRQEQLDRETQALTNKLNWLTYQAGREDAKNNLSLQQQQIDAAAADGGSSGSGSSGSGSSAARRTIMTDTLNASVTKAQVLLAKDGPNSVTLAPLRELGLVNGRHYKVVGKDKDGKGGKVILSRDGILHFLGAQNMTNGGNALAVLKAYNPSLAAGLFTRKDKSGRVRIYQNMPLRTVTKGNGVQVQIPTPPKLIY